LCINDDFPCIPGKWHENVGEILYSFYFQMFETKVRISEDGNYFTFAEKRLRY